ncbi:LbtU family siderophore porin [Thiocystis violacea]|uniref:LbtU family siderophore porin n=1 Tax=Thiocystis violacea TaxID=13725 RepID=UPI0019059E3E|nr:LbtU family siderophore porin [Thiocystis violacea]MBK1720862.1 hypothetical protein [Thiocystis violacea]
MKKPLGTATIALLMASPAAVSAESLETRLERLESRTAELEANTQRQEPDPAERKARTEGEPERLKPLSEELSASGLRQMIGGLIEVEAFHVSPYEGDDESDIVLATFELGISAQINHWVEATASLLYEQDETDLEVDVAYLSIANAEASPFFLSAGQLYVPFGSFETNLVSDPLTLEIGESRETALQVGFVAGDVLGSLYVFNGDNSIEGESTIGSWGANLGYAHEEQERAWAFGVGYINDLGDSDTLQDATNDNRVTALDAQLAEGMDTTGFNVDPTRRVGGWTLNASTAIGPFNLIGEYLSATDHFDVDSLAYRGAGAKPAAWNIEAGFSFPVLGRASVAAIAYQGTQEALALELPEERWLVGWSIALFEQTSLSFQWAHDRDYSESNGGTGESADTITAQLAVEF